MQGIAWKWKKCFYHICMRWKCSNRKSFMVFQNSRFFCLNFMLQFNCMQTACSNCQLQNKFWIWLLVSVKIFKVRVNVRVIFLSKLQGLNDRCNLRLVHFSFWWVLQFFRIFFEQHLHLFAYVLLQKWVWSYLAIFKIGSNGEIVCLEQTVMTRVAGNIQSSSRRNSGGRQLVLKPLNNSHCNCNNTTVPPRSSP